MQLHIMENGEILIPGILDSFKTEFGRPTLNEGFKNLSNEKNISELSTRPAIYNKMLI